MFGMVSLRLTDHHVLVRGAVNVLVIEMTFFYVYVRLYDGAIGNDFP